MRPLMRRLRSRRDERGVISTWTILTASGVFLVLLGLVYDGGNAMNERIEAHRAAEQAARAAADEMRGVRDGNEGINESTARARAGTPLPSPKSPASRSSFSAPPTSRRRSKGSARAP